ncbi:hypothetical protein MtrunA17_Chr6g0458221 [Medicago truncatula]|nr:hypothetical protein MtrunA17_Chr6g0458221 [Medicago truncatula]
MDGLTSLKRSYLFTIFMKLVLIKLVYLFPGISLIHFCILPIHIYFGPPNMD